MMKKATTAAAGACLLAIGLVALAAFSFWRSEREKAIARWNIRLTAMADDREMAIESWLGERRGDGQLVAGFPSVVSLLDGQPGHTVEEKDHVSGILATMVESNGYHGVYILNGRGEPVVTSPEAPPLSPACAEMLHQMPPGQSLRAFAFRGVRTGEVRLGFLVRVGKAPATPGVASPGWVLLIMDPSRWLLPLLAREPVPTRTGEVVLLYKDGGDLVHITPLKFRDAAPLSVEVPYDRKNLAGREAVLGHRLFGEFADYRKVPVLAATRPIAKTDWGMVVKVDKAEALAPFHQSMALQAAALCGILCILFAIGYGFLRNQRVIALRAVLEERVRSEGRILQLNRLLHTISAVNQLIVREEDRDSLLSEACRILVEQGPFVMAWVGSKEPDGRVVPIAQSKSADEYLECANARWDDTPEGRGPTGTAIREKRAVVNPDVTLNPAMVRWRAAALRANYLSSAAIPLVVQGEAVAALSVYCGEPDAIGDEEQALLEELGADLGYALQAIEEREEHRRTEDALLESEARYRNLHRGHERSCVSKGRVIQVSHQQPDQQRLPGPAR